MPFTDLLVPGGQRAESLVGDDAVLADLLAAERDWILAQADAGTAERPTALAAARAVGEPGDHDLAALAAAAEGGANPVIPLVRTVRERVREQAGDDAAGLVHRGLTSQDVLDTALMRMIRRALQDVHEHLLDAGEALADLVVEHAETPMSARTLGQHALPTTFGARAGRWLDALGEAACATDAAHLNLPVSGGGAAGTDAAVLSQPLLVDDAGLDASLPDRLGLLWARRLGLNGPASGQVWHTRRRPLVRALEPLEQAGAACARIANDVVVSSRAEIGELAEPAAPGRGGSSAMPHKRNPSLSILIRRSGVRGARALGEVLEAEALAQEERSELAWHLEWEPVRALARHAAIAASLTAELLGGLEVRPAAMAANLDLDGPEAPGRTPEGWDVGDSADQARAAARRWHRYRQDAPTPTHPARTTEEDA